MENESVPKLIFVVEVPEAERLKTIEVLVELIKSSRNNLFTFGHCDPAKALFLKETKGEKEGRRG